MLSLPGLFKKNYTCWICLESSKSDSSWFNHTCGCKIQLHKKCYIRWLYSLNKKLVTQPICTLEMDDLIILELKKKCTYLIDDNNELNTDISIGEVLLATPILGDYMISLTTMPLSVGATLVGFRKVIPFTTSELMYPPIRHGDCPQCKKPVISRRITYSRGSILLKTISILRKFSRIVATGALMEFFLLNGSRWWFKIGLGQLRLLFPEKVLKHLLSISTTKALDVYSDSLSGLAGLSETTNFIILGLPLYLTSLCGLRSPLSIVEWIWPVIVSFKARSYSNEPRNIIYRTILGTKLMVMSYRLFIHPALNSIYKKFVKMDKLYYADFEQDEPKDMTNVIIKTSWYDSLTQAFIWPWIGSYLGDKLFDSLIYTQRKFNFSFPFSSTPAETQMVFRFLGCGVAVLGKDLIKLYASYVRMKELEDLTNVIENTCKL
ncbi:hypothetical protein TBLA_0A02280 [Henningerozyma blattae CBS 6284]|uniref:RING-CH-type domain-containing protein n=1 Tax=Henningerozyma blattae (strain ATCC 34711 / CBS 6284 / DSM 70876 / NBRC 10599 / NRRL Y-10934 / UCD 77-7) TaxID=1071380 RepID=I2GV76_HENB6|nr:hypothetical protein TBLA_0A02280 [Tetrapisispora blattae CBS 6284]CCH58028.1 hypothetical protein TBLA_0A02280 [Tetrapisispora blattae CBS 6284]